MKLFLRKAILIAMVVALGLASLPIVSASAMGADDTTPPQGTMSNERLERIWARQLRIYERIGNVNQFIGRVQDLLDRASARGKDVASVQAALDVFSEAAKNAKPTYESMNGIVNSHQGFDANGKVTDTEKATETVKSIAEKLKEIKAITDGSGKALREAIQAFREANPRPWNTK